MTDARISLYTDGACRGNPGEGGIGIVFKDKDGNILGALNKYIGSCTNNEAEYQALLMGLDEAVRRGYRRLEIFMDSELVVKQITGDYRVRSKTLLGYILQVRNLLSSMEAYRVQHIDRNENKMADRLANEAIDEHYISKE